MCGVDLNIMAVNAEPPRTCLRSCCICREDLTEAPGWQLVRWQQAGGLPEATVLMCPACWAVATALSTAPTASRNRALLAQEQPLTPWHSGTLLLLVAELLTGPHTAPSLVAEPGRWGQAA